MDGPIELPLFPLHRVLVPGMGLPLHIFESRYKRLLQDCQAAGRFGVTLIKEGHEVGEPAVPHAVGTVAEITALRALPDGTFKLTAMGRERFRIAGLRHDRPYLRCDAFLLPEEEGDAEEARANDVRVRAFAADYLETLYAVLGERGERPHLQLPDDPLALSHTVAVLLQISPAETQELLEAPTAADRLAQEVDLLSREVAILRRMVRGRPRGKGPEYRYYSPN